MPYLENINESSLTELRKLVPFPVEFYELRIIQAWLDSAKKK